MKGGEGGAGARVSTSGALRWQVEIDIDSLDLPTFLKVDKYVQDCIARARKKNKA